MYKDVRELRNHFLDHEPRDKMFPSVKLHPASDAIKWLNIVYVAHAIASSKYCTQIRP